MHKHLQLNVSESDMEVSSVQSQTVWLLEGETVQQLNGEGEKQMSDNRSFTPDDFEEHVRLPAGRVGGTQWGNEYSICVVSCLHI